MHLQTAEPWATHFDMMTAAHRIRRFIALEQRLFEIVGQWVQHEPNVAAKLHFGEQCYHHIWHAQLLECLLPTPAEQYPAAYADTPDLSLLDGLFEALDRCAALFGEILPTLLAEYRAHLARTVPQTDAPTTRILRVIVADLEADLATGVRLRASTLK